MDTATAVTQSTLAQDRIYAYLKDAITSARLAPGQRLRADQLAQQARASRTPVREALSRLAQERLVERDEGWGYVVRQVTIKDVLDLFSVREALELQAAREVACRLTDVTVAELAALNRKAEELFEAGQHEAFLLQNRLFHGALARSTGNALLEHMLDLIHDRVRQVGSLLLRAHEPRARELLLENRRIMSAIRERDSESLVTAMSTHIRRGRELVVRLLTKPDVNAQVTFPAPSASPSRRSFRRSPAKTRK